MALAQKLEGGVAVLFAANESELDFMPYRQDSDFYYLTGWNEPGAALMIVSEAPQAASPPNRGRVEGRYSWIDGGTPRRLYPRSGVPLPRDIAPTE